MARNGAVRPIRDHTWISVHTMHRMEPQVFLRPAFHGGRFEGHAMPLDVLAELAAYQKIVIEVAKALYRRENPQRQRIPRGFRDELQLQLRKVEDGSAIPVLERIMIPSPQPQLSFSEHHGDIFERARDLINEVVAGTPAGSMPSQFPPGLFRLFNNLGRTLHEDEHIILVPPSKNDGPRYDRNVRKRLILREQQQFEDVVDVVGRVVMFDSGRRSFELLTKEGQRVPGPVVDAILRTIRSAVGQEDLHLHVVGVGIYDADDRLLQLLEIDELTLADNDELVDELDIEKRLNTLATLRPGWLGNQEGSALDRDGLKWLARILTTAVQVEDLVKPYLYPTPDGGVQAEWVFPEASVTAEIDLVEHTCELVGVHHRSNAINEKTVRLDDPAGVNVLANFIMGFAPPVTRTGTRA